MKIKWVRLADRRPPEKVKIWFSTGGDHPIHTGFMRHGDSFITDANGRSFPDATHWALFGSPDGPEW